TNGEPLMPVLVGFGGFFLTLGLTEKLAKMRGGYGHPVSLLVASSAQFRISPRQQRIRVQCTRLGANRVLIFRDYV
ncbi:hypothetical protein U1Q18_032506, partial [Sarracenia purpurea var. burkii]